MAVGLGVAGADVTNGTAGTTITTGSFTVSPTATSLLAVLTLASTTGVVPSGVTCAWNTSGTMTSVVGPINITGSTFWTAASTYFFGLNNPAQVTSTAIASWTGLCVPVFSLISFTGTHATTPFINSNSSTGFGGTLSTTITVPANGGAVAMAIDLSNLVASAAMFGTGVTPWFTEQSTSQNVAGYGFGSSNLTFQATDLNGPPGNWAISGIAIQPSVGGGLPPSLLNPKGMVQM